MRACVRDVCMGIVCVCIYVGMRVRAHVRTHVRTCVWVRTRGVYTLHSNGVMKMALMVVAVVFAIILLELATASTDTTAPSASTRPCLVKHAQNWKVIKDSPQH